MALVVNLWVGGDLVEAWLGHAVRNLFELVLICAWLVLVIGMRAPLPFRGSGRRPPPSEDGDERRS